MVTELEVDRESSAVSVRDVVSLASFESVSDADWEPLRLMDKDSENVWDAVALVVFDLSFV